MMALGAIVWFVSLLASVATIALTFGNIEITHMFPEGKRWWHFWSRLGALALFAGVVLIHPFH